MENSKPITDKKLAYELEGLWYKLHSVQISQKHFTIRERDIENVSEIMSKVLELRDEIRNKIYLTELEKENN